ncbi:alanine racemase [Arthrobacter sp. FW306-2-2C-D06B]|jgi:predicted amino acid racemase|uniref:alanine racemase n=1 Tax=Arthrobacter sp. FW306-2-2C-D06B TaxID=2879618 RepID=UPI001F20452A|nr:alanine racemase [Arthrobacter sp. FW306-2-2C-D06B]UKA59460.1 alanine racemase [Arthrobacter sp. FW306-2-2C-D06B]
MFVDLLRRRNPALLQAAARFHQNGQIPANSYVIDLDAVTRNAAAISAEASRLSLTPFAMTKQIGRNPDASRAIAAGGIDKAVGVDLECAIAAATGGLRIGHLGHLVQIPKHRAAEAAALEPLYWTVFSETKAAEAGAAAMARGRVQDVLLRIQAPGDRFYRGHEGGFNATDVVGAADRIDAIGGVRFAGITTFPATLFDATTGAARSTPNLATLTTALRALERAGRRDVQVNAPGTTSVSILAALAEAGATQVEPGHGLTGTTPIHAVQDLVEEPAIAYVSEVSHLWNGDAYVFGGGLYVDPVLGGSTTTALLVAPDTNAVTAPELRVDMPAADAIDYYATVPLGDHRAQPGDTVLFGFRPQVFVTRALTAGIAGLSTGTPTVAGIWSSDGSAPLTISDTLAAPRRTA